MSQEVGTSDRSASPHRRPRCPSVSLVERPHAFQRVEQGGGTSSMRVSRVNTSQQGGRAPATRSAPQNWQYISSQRCLTCGRLGCTRCAVRPDPELRRQKLHSLRLNTPYERHKLLRTTDELLADETRRREKLEGYWCQGWQDIADLRERVAALAAVAQEEQHSRLELCRAEGGARVALCTQLDDVTVYFALLAHERESRAALMEIEATAWATIGCQWTSGVGLVWLVQRERVTRHTLAYNEAARRARLCADEAAARRARQGEEEARLACLTAYLDTREQLWQARLAAMEQLTSLAAESVRQIGQHVQARMALVNAALQGAASLAAREQEGRRWLLECRTAAFAELEASQRAHAEQRARLVQDEAAARSALLAERSASLHELFLQRSEAAEAVERASRARALRREAALREACTHLHSIAGEEAAAFAELRACEAAEREARYAWILQKADVRAECVRQAEVGKAVLARDEEEARRQICVQRQRDEAAVASWVLWCERQCRQLYDTALTTVQELTKEEHQVRFAIVSAMAENEERVRQRCQLQLRQRAELAAEEAAARERLIAQECHSREEHGWFFAAAVDELRARTKAAADRRSSLMQAYLAARQVVASEEDKAWATLCSCHAGECASAQTATWLRLQAEVAQAEVLQRTALMREEMTERGTLATRYALALRCLAEEAQVRLQMRLCATEADEARARALCVQAWQAGFQTLLVQEQEERVAQLASEEGLRQAALRARQVELTEDQRMYNVDELLPVEHTSSVRCSGASIRHSNGSTQSSKSLSQTQVRVVNTSQNLQRAFYGQLLGVSASAHLDASSMPGVAAILDAILARRAQTKDALQAAQRRTQEAERRLVQQQAKFVEAREKRDMYTTNMQRETDERARRLAQEAALKQRNQEQMERERCRLSEMQRALNEAKHTLESLRQSIQKRYKQQ